MLLEFDPGIIVKFVVITISSMIGMALARIVINKRAQKKAEQEKQGPEEKKP